MSPQRILFIAHDHPALRAGGAEVYAYELFRALGEDAELETSLLAGNSSASQMPPAPDRPFHPIENEADEILWHVSDYDRFLLTSNKKTSYTVDFARYLEWLRPSLVHVQHSAGLGLDLLRQIRSSCPGIPIVYTLHEFQPICHAEGLMLRTSSAGGSLCDLATPARCAACFPEIPSSSFLLRKAFVRARLDLVDLFLAPSHFLLERFVRWGIDESRIRFLENGRRLPGPEASSARPTSSSHFGFFGQVAPHKGVLTLLEATHKLVEQGHGDGLRLTLHGGNLEMQSADFQRRVDELMTACRGVARLAGAYSIDDLPSLMRDIAWVVVPSIWWENSPLVIQEAFSFRRPVICSDVGGMAEKVTHERDGLHFRLGDADHLAHVMHRAAGVEAIWERCREAIPTVFSLEEAVVEHKKLYRELLCSA